MKFSIDDWRTLIALRDWRSVTAAAEFLGVSQSAFSHRLTKIRELDPDLFAGDPGPRRTVRLSPGALRKCERAEAALHQLQLAEADEKPDSGESDWLTAHGENGLVVRVKLMETPDAPTDRQQHPNAQRDTSARP